MPDRRLLITALLALACHAAPPAGRAPAPTRPNVVVVITDDQGLGDFGFQGHPVLRTPNLDAMAAASARLSTFYVHPVCAPTRAALMTGRYPQRTRAIDTYIGRAMLEPDEVTLAEHLRAGGWATGLFGKWHLGDCYPMRPQDQGFEEVLMHRGGGIGQPSDPEGGEGRYTDAVLFRNGERVETEGYCTDVYFDAAFDWMDRARGEGRPFFCYIATNAPHGPFHDVPEELREHYAAQDLSNARAPQDVGHPLPERHDADRTARIYAMIENVDQNVGRLFAELEEHGELERTLVLFLVDNGPNTRRYVRGYRGMKSHVHEGGVRSPLLAHWAGTLEPGEVAGVGAHLDLLPTVLEAADLPPAEEELDGRSLWGLLTRREEPEPRTLVIQSHRGNAAVPYHHFFLRRGDWKLVNASGFGREVEAVTPEFELYDLARDPYEERDLAAQLPQLVAELRAEYDAWFEDVSNTRPDNYAPPRIHVGDTGVREVHLTRQDWRCPLGGPHRLGHWSLRVSDPGPYDLRVRFPQGRAPERLAVRWRGKERVVELDGEHDEVRLTDTPLEPGDGELELRLTEGDETYGPYQVVLRR